MPSKVQHVKSGTALSLIEKTKTLSYRESAVKLYDMTEFRYLCSFFLGFRQNKLFENVIMGFGQFLD